MPAKNLAVFLNDRSVGFLSMLPDGRSFLAFGEQYITDPNRPILSLSYKNVLNDLQKNAQPPSMVLPPFFSNLLPEGKLRKYLAKKANVKETQEFRLLEALKDDLPGAVILKPDIAPAGSLPDIDDNIPSQKILSGSLRFSLAGIQMKFSGNLQDSKIVIPARGVGGHWIVKLPSLIYKHINEIEYSMLLLASKIGIAVPDFRLVPTSDLENLPQDLPEAVEGACLISRRFDRTASGGRIHMEDFAQVFNVIDKYDRTYNYQSIANVLWVEIGLDAVLEFVRRLVHMIVTGNADMHLKNWSLIYPDGRHPMLSPAYDLVSTTVFSDIDRTLPHKMAGINSFEQINSDTFKAFAQIAKLPERAVLKTVQETVDAIKECWPTLREDLPIPASYKRLIEEHMDQIPLLLERPTIIAPASPIPLGVTWLGSFFNYDVFLDESIPDGTIVYKNQAGRSITTAAPRRMAKVVLENELHQVVRDNRDFSNQKIECLVGPHLYDEWRNETYIRIPSRLVEGGLDEGKLQEPELTFRASFFPIAWHDLQKHYSVKEQGFTLDFVLDNGELWTCECTLVSLDKIELLPAGTLAKVRLYLQRSKHLLTLPPQSKNKRGSSKFSI